MHAGQKDGFSFALLGDLHYDKLQHHNLDWLQAEKPDDLRQVRNYSRLTSEIIPSLFGRTRDAIKERQNAEAPIALVVQVGDLVEGLCGSETLAVLQNSDVLEFLKKSSLRVPFLFAKGNHDITGQGAPEAFKTVFHPFLSTQLGTLGRPGKVDSACFSFERGDTLFCFFDAYDKESLPWLEAALAARTQRHCFLVLHPPVIPYGARSTWHVFSAERDRTKRERLLELLGKHNVFVLSGHIHKHNLTVRTTAGGGRFLQFALSSVISSASPQPRDILDGLDAYSPDQVKIEPGFSPATEQQRREVYLTERKFVRQFQYADLPGYAVVEVSGPKVSVQIFAGTTTTPWRTLDLTRLLSA